MTVPVGEVRRLALVGEGKGEVTAVPSLASRILRENGRDQWIVTRDLIRLPRGQLIDEAIASPSRPPRAAGFARAVAVASAQKAEAIVVLVDSDSDCPVAFGPPAARFFSPLRGVAVMAVREFESWLVLAHPDNKLKNVEQKRDAKGVLAKLVEGYKPTTHQLALTSQINIPSLRALSTSFDKFVRGVLEVTV